MAYNFWKSSLTSKMGNAWEKRYFCISSFSLLYTLVCLSCPGLAWKYPNINYIRLHYITLHYIQGGDHSTICILIVNVHLKHCVKCSLLTEKTCKTVEGKKHTLCTAQTKYYVLFLLERICKQRQKERSRTERILTRPGKFLIAGPHAVIRASTAQIYYIPYYT